MNTDETNKPSPQDTPTQPDSVRVHPASSANLAAFGSEILEAAKERVADCGGGEEDEEIMQLAFKHGLIARVKWDPEKHGYGNYDARPGDEIWWWGSGWDSQNDGAQRACGPGGVQ